MSKRRHIVFTTLAFNQTLFFVGLAKELLKHGYETSIISFHEESIKYIQDNNIAGYNIFEYHSKNDTRNLDEIFADLMDRYRIENPNLILSHEKVAFNIKDTDRIVKKYIHYFHALETIFEDIKSKASQPIITVQELGGFSSILSTYYLSLKQEIDNIFIEPSFFRGRVFFIKNSLKSINISYADCKIEKELHEYLNSTLSEKKIVIPSKDQRGYKNPINKIFNVHNIKRYGQKIYSKFFLKQNEEFSHIGHHVRKHIKMLINQLLLKKYYRNIPDGKFIYFPMHVPNDVALTIRSPEYLEQLSLIYYISRNLPLGYKLVIKEHPAMLGDIDKNKICELMDKDSNIVLLKPWINNFDVLSQADIIITINSKAGAEAILNRKKVIVLGDAFYDKSPLIQKVDCLKELFPTILKLAHDDFNDSQQEIYTYFQNIWQQSYVGDLYYGDKANYISFCHSLRTYLDTIQ